MPIWTILLQNRIKARTSFLIAGLIIYTVFLLNFRLRHFEKNMGDDLDRKISVNKKGEI